MPAGRLIVGEFRIGWLAVKQESDTAGIARGLAHNEALARLALPSGWNRRTIRRDGREICVLEAEHPADVLAVPLECVGRREIHLGVVRPRGVAASMQVRFSSDRFWRKVQPHLFIDDPGGGLQDGNLGVREVSRGESLLLRTEPGCRGAIGYLYCVPAEAEEETPNKRNVGAVIDVHNVYSKHRIDEPDDLLGVIAPFAESDFDRICWGTAGGSFRATYLSEVMPRLGEGLTEFPREAGRITAGVLAMFERRGVDPLRLVVDFAHEIGLQLWANDRICHCFDPADRRQIHLMSDFYERNQHMRVLTMEGDKHFQAMLSLAYPEFRDLKVRFLVEQARRGVDGIYLDYTRKSPVVGWEPAVLDSFKTKYGKDPRALPEAEWMTDWLAHQAGFVTLFMRELRAALDGVEAESGRRLPVAAQVPAGFRFYRSIPECYGNGLDVAAWAQEGLVDIVAPSTDLWHSPIRLDHLSPMLEPTRCELWGCIHQRAEECYPSRQAAADENLYLEAHVDPTIVLRTAADLYNQGAAGILLWESGELPSVLPRWECLKGLGDRDGLADLFGPRIGSVDGRRRIEQLSLE